MCAYKETETNLTYGKLLNLQATKRLSQRLYPSEPFSNMLKKSRITFENIRDVIEIEIFGWVCRVDKIN